MRQHAVRAATRRRSDLAGRPARGKRARPKDLFGDCRAAAVEDFEVWRAAAARPVLRWSSRWSRHSSKSGSRPRARKYSWMPGS